MASITTFFGTQGGGGSVSGTATRVAFFGGTPGNPSTTLDDSASLEWDDTNSRVSVGDAATVGSTVTIAGTTASDATSALEVRTSSAYADNLLFRVYDNGRIETRTLDSSEAVTDKFPRVTELDPLPSVLYPIAISFVVFPVVFALDPEPM